MELNYLSLKVRGAIFEVFKELGPGLLASVYEATLFEELTKMNLRARTQVGLPVEYKEKRMEIGFRIDLLVEETIIIEVKSVELLHNIHKKQVLTYLKLADKKLGFLVNFNESKLVDKENLIRIIN